MVLTIADLPCIIRIVPDDTAPYVETDGVRMGNFESFRI